MAQAVEQRINDIVFIDASVSGYQALLTGLPPGAQVVMIDDSMDGIAQISAYLSGKTEIGAIHLVSHGEAGTIEIGSSVLTGDTLPDYAAQIAGWSASLAPDADLLLYGCDVAANDAGKALVRGIAGLTGADVAASTHLVGNTALGGSPTLDYDIGSITELTLDTSKLDDVLSHFRASTLTWNVVSGRTVQFNMQSSFRASYFGTVTVGSIVNIGTPFYFGDGANANIYLKILSVNTVNDTFVGQFVTSAGVIVTHTYAADQNYTAYWQSSNRLSTTQNFANTGWESQTIVDVGKGTRSPNSSLAPIIQLADNTVASFQIPASDADGDTLVYKLGTAQQFISTTSSASTIVAPSGLTVDQNTGVVTWDIRNSVQPSVSAGQLWVATVMVEAHDPTTGALKSETPLDFLLQIVDTSVSQPPVFDVVPPATTVYAGQQTEVVLHATDPGMALVGISALNPPTGMTTTFDPTDGELHVDFTPTQAEAGSSFVVTFQAIDAQGLTTNTSVTFTVANTMITSDTASPATGDYTTGQVITFTLAVNGAVTVTGTPALTLNDGGTATYVAGQSTSTSLVFSTTVAAGQNATTLAVTGVDLSSGATIKDGGGNALVLTGANATFTGLQVDTTPPTASSVALAVAENAGATPIGLAAPVDASTVTISVTALPNDGQVTLADGVTAVAVNQVLTAAQLTGLRFTPTAGQFSQASTLTYSVVDAAGNASTGTATLTIGGPGAPTITGAVAGQAVTDAATLRPFAGVVIGDPNAGQTETVTVTPSLTANGTLSDPNAATSGSTIVNGVLSVSGTAAQVTAALDGLVFTPTANQVAPGQTVTTGFTVAVSDTAGQSASNASTTVVATSVNDAPVLGNQPTTETTTDKAALSPLATVTLADADVGQTQLATVTLSAANGALSNLGTGTLSANGLTYTVAGTAAAVQAALRGLVFTPMENQVAPGNTVSTIFGLSDTDGTAMASTSTVLTATSVNDAPVLGGQPATETTTDKAVISPFATVAVTDVDVGQTQTATVTLSAANGALSNLGGGTLSPGGLTYTVAGTTAVVQAALRGLVFTPVQNQVTPGSTVSTTLSLSDTDGLATASTSTVLTATSVNDAPVISGTMANQAVTDKVTPTPFATVTVTDPDVGQTETLVITVVAGSTPSDANGVLTGAGLTHTGTGLYTLAAGTPAAVTAALDALVFTPTANQVTPGQTVTTRFTLTVSDTVQTATDSTTSVVATSVNDAPVLGGQPATEATTDKAAVSPFLAVTLADANVGQTQTATATLSAANGTLSNLGGGTLSANGLTYTVAGTAAAVQAALRGLVFTPTQNQVAPGGTVSTTLSLSDTDGTATSTASTVLATTSVNDAPAIGGTQAGQTARSGTALAPFAAATLADPDAGAAEAVTVTLRSSAGVATDTQGTLSGAGLTQVGVGTYQLAAGSPAAAQAALRTVQFTPAANLAATTQLLLSVSDGIAPVVTDGMTTVVASLMPPVVTGVTAAPADANLGVGGAAVVTVAFSAAVTVVGGPPTLGLNDGGVATYDASASTATALVFRTTVAAGQNSADLASTGLALNGATIRDGTGNDAVLTGAAANPAGTLAVDTQAPVVTVSLRNDTGASATDGVTAVPVLTGTAEAGGVVTVRNGTAVLGMATVGADGGWSVTPMLADGSYTLTASETDAAGNTGTAALGFTLDRVAPVVTLALANNTASAASGGTTRDASVSGTGEAGGTVVVSENGTALAAVTVGADGSWAFSPALPAGAHTLTASETDAAGNIGAATLRFTLDQPPAIGGTQAGQAVADTATVRPFAAVSLSDPDAGALETVVITVLDMAGAATDGNGTLSGPASGLGLSKTGVGRYALAAGTPAQAAATLAALVFTPAAGQAAPGASVTTRFAVLVTDDQGATAANNTTSVVATGGQHPFAVLMAGNPDPAATVTVSAQLLPATPGAYANLAGGTVSADGLTYTVSGTAAQVSAALAGVVFAPAAGQAVPNAVAAAVSDAGGASTLSSTAPGGSVLQANAPGDIVTAGSGADTLVAGAAGTRLVGRAGGDVFLGNATGSSTLVGGTGSNVFFARGGPTRIEGGPGHDVVSAPSGNVTVVSGTGGSVIGLGSGTSIVNGNGADTIIAGTGAVTIGSSAGSLVSLGAGPAVVSAAAGTTVVGGAGADTVGVRGDGILFFAGAGPGVFIGGTGNSTVAGGSGSETIFGGAGGGVFGGGSGGSNVIVAGQRATTIFGGGNGDVLYAAGSAGDVLVAGAGNETLAGAGSSGNDAFFAGPGNTLVWLGSGQDVVFAGTGASTVMAGTGRDVLAFANGRAGGSEVIVGFKLGTDQVSLQGYAAGEIGRALASAVSTPGSATTAASTTLTLSDNTRITFQNIANVDARVFG